MDHVYDSINKNKCVLSVFVDIQKTFDTINLNIIFSKLEKYGIRGFVLEFPKEYLRYRQQVLTVKD